MHLPIVDLRSERATQPERWADVVGLAFTRVGALALRLPCEVELQHQVRQVLAVLDLGEAAKWSAARQSLHPGSRFRWVGYGVDRAGSEVLHEMFDIGAHGMAPVDELAGGGEAFAEVTPVPQGLPDDWVAHVTKLRATLAELGRGLVRAAACHLRRDEAASAAGFVDDNSTLRVLHYPPHAAGEGSRIRGAAHEDSGAFTFIWEDNPGLEIRDRSGAWVRSGAPVWTVIAGEALSIMTGGVVPATTHRVAGSGERRRSLAFFFEPALDAPLVAWPSTEALGTTPRRGMTYGKWLRIRHHVAPTP